MAIENNWEISKLGEKTDKRVAIVGGGPAGIAAAAYLARRGVFVCIYEKHEDIGGLLVHGIPGFRLPREVIKSVIKKVLDLGVKVELGKELGQDIDLDFLKKNYDAVLLTFGANVSSKMGIEGEELNRGIWR